MLKLTATLLPRRSGWHVSVGIRLSQRALVYCVFEVIRVVVHSTWVSARSWTTIGFSRLASDGHGEHRSTRKIVTPRIEQSKGRCHALQTRVPHQQCRHFIVDAFNKTMTCVRFITLVSRTGFEFQHPRAATQMHRSMVCVTVFMIVSTSHLLGAS